MGEIKEISKDDIMQNDINTSENTVNDDVKTDFTTDQSSKADVVANEIQGSKSDNEIQKSDSDTNKKDNEEENQSNERDETSDMDIFDVDKVVKYSSDEESDGDDVDGDDDDDESDVSKSEKELESGSSSYSDSDSDSDSSSDSDSCDSDSESEDNNDNDKYNDLEDEINEGDENTPIVSKNEILDFKVPSIPNDYKIEEDAKIQYIGFISGVVDKNVLVKASMSAEYNVLNEGTIFCFEDRTPVGLLYEVIGRLQSPVYTIRFNTSEEAENFKDKKGSKIFYVESSAEFLSTQHIRQFKGTDASNWHDEEIPEEEQEFSDDEKEALSKKNKKKKKTKSKNSENDKTNGSSKNDSIDNHINKKPKFDNSVTSDVPLSVKARLTSLPKKVSNKPHQQNISSQIPNPSSFIPQNIPAQNPVAMMQQFMGLMQQQSQAYSQNNTAVNNYSYPPQFGQQYTQQYPQQYNTPYNQGFNQYTQGYNQNQQGYNQYNAGYSQMNSSFSQGYNPAYPQTQQPQQAQPQQFNSSYSPNLPQAVPQQQNNSLLIAQLAAALTNNVNKINPMNQINNQNNNGQSHQDDEYDPEK